MALEHMHDGLGRKEADMLGGCPQSDRAERVLLGRDNFPRSHAHFAAASER